LLTKNRISGLPLLKKLINVKPKLGIGPKGYTTGHAPSSHLQSLG